MNFQIIPFKTKKVSRQFLRRGLLLLLLLLTACNAATPTPTIMPTDTAHGFCHPLPPPVANTTAAPDVKTTAQAWLEAWAKDDISGMCDLLTPVSQDALTRDKFIARYTDVANNLTLQKIEAARSSRHWCSVRAPGRSPTG